MLFLLFSIGALFAQQKRAVDFIGGARSMMSNNRILVTDSFPDTLTTKRNTGGYALIDLGVNIKPNKNTEILGMFRIRNQYGGFWGSGVSFDVRQLWLKGVIANVVRYQVGDLNLKQTPFTLYNHHADKLDSLPAIFNFQNQIISYEKFYLNNTWRQQGVNLDFGLKFSKYLKEADFDGYLTRLLATDFAKVPDRLMGGFTVNILQSKNFGFGYNNFSVFDVKGTIIDSNRYRNLVNTFSFIYKTQIKNKPLEIKAEAGRSLSETTENITASSMQDYFIHAYTEFKLPKQHLNLSLGYLNVGPDFRSIGAQSKNVNYNATPEFYNRYGNAQSSRPLSVMDIIRNDNLYTTSVNSNLMVTSPIYNNILPYGIATFNRVGAYLKAKFDNQKGITCNATHNNLSEIRGQGTFALKKFTQTKVNAALEINKIISTKRSFKIQAGLDLQSTMRKSQVEVEHVKLNTLIMTVGLEYELFSNIDILLGTINVNNKGNDFSDSRNAYSVVDYLTNVNYDLHQQITAFGIRCRFSDRIYLCGNYQYSNYNDKLNLNPQYKLNQFAITYNMTF